MKSVLSATILALTAATGCIPVPDYTGTYDMTYDVVLEFTDAAHADVRAGLAHVEVRDGLASEYLLDLGASLCRMVGDDIVPRVAGETAHVELAPQPCWFTDFGKTYPMTLAGSAAFENGTDERFTVVLSGTVRDDAAKRVGSATVQLTESW